METKPQRPRSRRLYYRLLFLPILAIGYLFGLGVMSKTEKPLGLYLGQLKPLPITPNCVSSQAADPERFLAPIPFDCEISSAKAKLIAVLGRLPRTQLITEEGNYLHFTSTSLLFRFVDDLEFLIEPGKKLIQFRSASRVGYSDMGVNRKRMQAIVEKMTMAPE